MVKFAWIIVVPNGHNYGDFPSEESATEWAKDHVVGEFQVGMTRRPDDFDYVEAEKRSKGKLTFVI